MMPAWHQLVSMSGHVEESETARKLQLYATSIYQVHSFVCQLDYIGIHQLSHLLFAQLLVKQKIEKVEFGELIPKGKLILGDLFIFYFLVLFLLFIYYFFLFFLISIYFFFCIISIYIYIYTLGKIVTQHKLMRLFEGDINIRTDILNWTFCSISKEHFDTKMIFISCSYQKL